MKNWTISKQVELANLKSERSDEETVNSCGTVEGRSGDRGRGDSPETSGGWMENGRSDYVGVYINRGETK